MFDFNYYTPTRVVFGRGAQHKTGKLAAELGAKRALIHYGGQSAERSGLLDEVRASLGLEGIEYIELGGVVPNPRLGKVREGIALVLENDVDIIIAVGGGSAIDSAKAIAYGAAEPDKDVWDLFEKKRAPKRSMPIGAVLTISAAGSEMSSSCVITNEDTGEKRSYGNDLSRPKFAVMNPELTMTLPDYQTQSGCTDIMMHTMERYFTQGGNMELTDEIAEGLLRTVMKCAIRLGEDPHDYDARAEVMWASSLSHNGLTGCGNDGGDFVSHSIEHEIGGMFDVTHGAGLAAIWGAWARYVYRDCLPRFVRFAVNVMGVPAKSDDEAVARAGIEAMERFYKRIGMPTSLSELGIAPTDEQIEEMARSCARATGGKRGSARVLYKDDFVNIYKAARDGSSCI